ncbi:MAG: hypothetical protein IJK44_03020 [Bacteroidales bacterium]|nr:hypothetical protein [Bacteroidales bacterium]
MKQVPWYVYAVMCAAIALVVAGFCVPPTGIIDGSVLKAIGELMGGAAVLEFVTNLKAYIEAGAKAKIEHGGTTITIGKNEENDAEADN